MSDDKPKCPACGSLALTAGVRSTTDVYYPPFSDDEGRWHEHDANLVRQSHTCRKCGEEFLVDVPPRRCWCGYPTEEP